MNAESSVPDVVSWLKENGISETAQTIVSGKDGGMLKQFAASMRV